MLTRETGQGGRVGDRLPCQSWGLRSSWCQEKAWNCYFLRHVPHRKWRSLQSLEARQQPLIHRVSGGRVKTEQLLLLLEFREPSLLCAGVRQKGPASGRSKEAKATFPWGKAGCQVQESKQIQSHGIYHQERDRKTPPAKEPPQKHCRVQLPRLEGQKVSQLTSSSPTAGTRTLPKTRGPITSLAPK